MEARVAVLEEIAKSTKEGLGLLRAEMRDMRLEMRDLRTVQERDFRILFAALIFVAPGLAGMMARGFHWF